MTEPPAEPDHFVARDGREALLEAFAALASQHGYQAVRPADAEALAGARSGVFGRHFSSNLDCLLAAHDAAVEQTFSAASRAYAATDGTWAQAAHAALRAVLVFLARSPDFARLSVADLPRAGARGRAHLRRSLDQLCEFLEPGFAGSGTHVPQSRLVAEVIAGGIFDLVRRHVADGRVTELPATLPGATVLALTPFVGVEEARRIAAEDPVAGAGTFEARDDRERLLAAYVVLAARDGMEAVTPADVATRAGVPVEAFHTHFPGGPAECLLAAYDAAIGQAFSAAAQGFMSAPGTWAEGSTAALGGLLRFLGGAPAFVRLCVFELPKTGACGRSHQARAQEQFAEFLAPGYARSDADGADPELVAEVVVGGIFDIVRQHATEGRIDELPRALPQVTLLALAPFVGAGEARRLADTARER
jgi:AcrR family transcriptional regulator